MKKVKRLFGEFKPEHYELYLEPSREKATFAGRVVITGQKTGKPSYRLTLHQKGLKISKASLIHQDKRGKVKEIEVDRINTHSGFDELRLHCSEVLYPGRYEIKLEFRGKITEPMHGIYPCNFKQNGKEKQLIATQFESHHAREAFPCIDEPEAKATFSLSLVSPAGETAISNTPIKSQKTKNGQLITLFETTPKMSTYLLAFVYGELGFKEGQTANGTKIRVYAAAGKVKLTDLALDTAIRSLDFFENYYGVPYPLSKMDLVGLPDFSAAAMENWGLVTFRESVLFVDPKSSSVETKQFVAMVIGHEFAHQWFGDLVTMKWWDDLWLNESFAEMMGYRVVDELFPEWNIWADFVRREVSAALSRDSLPNVQAVKTAVNHPDELATLFDPSIVYAKGAALINTVRNLLGEDDFRKGLKSYFLEHQYSNTTADDLWRHLKKASHVDIGSVMKNWLEKPGFPVLEVDLDTTGKSFNVSQSRLIAGAKPAADHSLWQVPLAASLPLDKSLLVKKSDTFKLTKTGTGPLTLNHDSRSYFITRYLNQAHFEQILKSVKDGSLSLIDRLLLVQHYLLMEKAGQVSTLDNIKLLPAYQNEHEDSVWGALASIIGNVRALADKDEALEAKINVFVRPIVKPLVKELGWKAAKNESAQTQKLRTTILSIAAGAQDEEVKKEGLDLFAKFSEPADLAPDIRQVVYYLAIRYGTKKDFNKLVELYKRTDNADEKDEIALELTSTRNPEHIKKLLSMITGNSVRLQDAPAWFAWLMRNRYGTELAWQWLKDNWSWIENKYYSDKSYDRFPRYAGMVFSRPTELKEYSSFFKPKMNISLERAIKLGIEEIEGRIAWRQKNEQPVKDWLKGL